LMLLLGSTVHAAREHFIVNEEMHDDNKMVGAATECK
jgi:hypothetical protein